VAKPENPARLPDRRAYDVIGRTLQLLDGGRTKTVGTGQIVDAVRQASDEIAPDDTTGPLEMDFAFLPLSIIAGSQKAFIHYQSDFGVEAAARLTLSRKDVVAGLRTAQSELHGDAAKQNAINRAALQVVGAMLDLPLESVFNTGGVIAHVDAVLDRQRGTARADQHASTEELRRTESGVRTRVLEFFGRVAKDFRRPHFGEIWTAGMDEWYAARDDLKVTRAIVGARAAITERIATVDGIIAETRPQPSLFWRVVGPAARLFQNSRSGASRGQALAR
jgi:hypothetical protein